MTPDPTDGILRRVTDRTACRVVCRRGAAGAGLDRPAGCRIWRWVISGLAWSPNPWVGITPAPSHVTHSAEQQQAESGRTVELTPLGERLRQKNVGSEHPTDLTAIDGGAHMKGSLYLIRSK